MRKFGGRQGVTGGQLLQQQLATLAGRHVKQVRKTDESPPRISVIDVALALTGKTQHDAAQDYRRMLEQ